jgi:hypothetical protein
MKYINVTPHTVRLTNGSEFPSKGCARVRFMYGMAKDDHMIFYQPIEVTGLPEMTDGVRYIVSWVVAHAVDRPDLVVPAGGHPYAIKQGKRVLSVPGFVRPGARLGADGQPLPYRPDASVVE